MKKCISNEQKFKRIIFSFAGIYILDNNHTFFPYFMGKNFVSLHPENEKSKLSQPPQQYPVTSLAHKTYNIHNQ